MIHPLRMWVNTYEVEYAVFITIQCAIGYKYVVI